MPIEAAIEELQTNSGTQFDPRVVEALVEIIERDVEPPQPASPATEAVIA